MNKFSLTVCATLASLAMLPSSATANDAATNPKSISIQDDPLNTGSDRPRNAADLLKRISDRSVKELDLQGITKDVLNGSLTTKPEDMRTLTVEIINEALDSENAIEQLNQQGAFFEALATTTTKATQLVASAEKLIASRDNLNTSLKKGSELDQRFEAQEQRYSVLEQFVRSQIDESNKLRNQVLNLQAEIQNLKSNSDITSLPSSLGSVDAEYSESISIPISVLSTTVIENANGRTGRAKVFVEGGSSPIEVNEGFATRGYAISRIDADGIELVKASNGAIYFLENGE